MGKSPGLRGSLVLRASSREGSATASGRRNSALISVKMAVLAPTPQASVSTATTVNPGLLSRVRTANRICWSISQPPYLLDVQTQILFDVRVTNIPDHRAGQFVRGGQEAMF